MSDPSTGGQRKETVGNDGRIESDRSAQKVIIATPEEIDKVVDAVTGATWGTRNTIMEGLFKRDLRTRADQMPSYRPPGEA